MHLFQVQIKFEPPALKFSTDWRVHADVNTKLKLNIT